MVMKCCGGGYIRSELCTAPRPTGFMRSAVYKSVTSDIMFVPGGKPYARGSFVSCRPNHSEVHFSVLLDSSRQYYLRR